MNTFMSHQVLKPKEVVKNLENLIEKQSHVQTYDWTQFLPLHKNEKRGHR